MSSNTVRPIGVSLPNDIIQEIRARAKAEDRTFSNMLVQIVRRALPHAEKRENTYKEH